MVLFPDLNLNLREPAYYLPIASQPMRLTLAAMITFVKFYKVPLGTKSNLNLRFPALSRQ